MAMNIDRQCTACGTALGGGQFCERCGADQKALAFEADKARLLHSGPQRAAKSSLLWVAGLTVLGTLMAFAQSRGEGVFQLAFGLIFAALYVALWHWSKRQPLGATAAGLGVFVTLHAANAVIEPATIVQGLVGKVVILVLLIRGVRAGVILRGHGVHGL
jgi:hypothetical protein